MLAQVAAELRQQGLEVSIPLTGKTRKPSASGEVWQEYREHHPFLRPWLAVEGLTKELAFYAQLREDRVNPKYTVLVRSGRTSARSPNIQQIPRDGELRTAFVASPGYLLLEIDYKFIELITLAAVCLRRYGRSALADVIKAGQDPHSHTAAMMLGVSPGDFLAWKDDPTKKDAFAEARRAAKAVNFGVPGGLGVRSLADYAKHTFDVRLTEDEARQKREQLLAIYPELQDYLAEDGASILARNLQADPAVARAWWGALFHLTCVRKVLRDADPKKEDGQPYNADFVRKVWAILAVLNRNPDLADDLANRRPSKELAARVCLAGVSTLTGRVRGGVSYTQCRNTPFQGLAADGAALALFALVRAGFRVVGFVHDAFLIELPDLGGYVQLATVREAEQIVCAAMARVLGCDLPVTVESKLARRWYKDGKLVIDGDRVLPWVPEGGEALPEVVMDVPAPAPAVTPAPVLAAPAVVLTASSPGAEVGAWQEVQTIEEVRQLPPLGRFFWWIVEREAIRRRRLAGQPGPWTSYEILRDNSFCNVKRWDDRTSQWLWTHWYEPHRDHPHLLLAAVLARRLFNFPEILEEISFPDRWDPARVKAIVRERMAAGKKVEHVAYVIPPAPGVPQGTQKHAGLIDKVVQPLVDNPPRLDTSSMQASVETLASRYGFKSFTAGQVVADLRWGMSGSWADKDVWAPQGPGSTEGLRRLDGQTGEAAGADMPRDEFERRFARVLAEVRRRLSAELNDRLEAIDVQNCLCEVAKLEQLLEGKRKKPRKFVPRMTPA
jgi:hypothetical protein